MNHTSIASTLFTHFEWCRLPDKQRLVASLITGTITGLIAITMAFSVAALIFSGKLSSQVSIGIGLALFGSIVVGLVISLFSQFRCMTGFVQEVPGVILALIAGAIVASFPAGAAIEPITATVIGSIAIGSLATGALYWLLGRLQLGNLVRFIPYPVIAGFLAATGWILVLGGIGVCAGLADHNSLATLFSGEALVHWLPGFGAGAMMLLVSLRYRHFLVFPALLIAITVVFFLVLWVSDYSLAEATAAGWLLQAPEGELLHLMAPQDWQQVEWSMLLEQLPAFLVLLVLSVLSLLLNVNGLELSTQQPIDLNRELRSSGIAHLLAGAAGGAPGYQVLATSALGHKLGANSRLVGMSAVLIMALPLLLGGVIVALFPKVLLGGMLIYFGLDFLYHWLWQIRRRLPLTDYGIVVLILVVSIVFGFLEGVGVGLIAAVILFVVRYLRISVIKNEFSAAIYHSRQERSPQQRQLLREQGEAVSILQLQGFIFFGTSQQLLDRWRARVDNTQQPALRYSILDCRLVTGFDASALLSLKRLTQFAEQHNVPLILTALSPEIDHTLSLEGLDRVVQRFPTLDRAVEWCENQLLQSASADTIEPGCDGLAGQLRTYIDDDNTVQRLLSYFKRQPVKAGKMLIRQGEIDQKMLLVETGQVTILLQTTEGTNVRVRTMQAGSVIGEMGLYANQPRTASVVANTDCVVHCLDRVTLLRIEREEPKLANTLHRAMLELMAERLVDTTSLVRAMAL